MPIFRADRIAKRDEIESIEALPAGAVVTVVRWSFGGFRQPDGVMRSPGKDRMSLVRLMVISRSPR